MKAKQIYAWTAALSLGGVALPGVAAAATACGDLASLTLTDTTITAAQLEPAGAFTAANGQTFTLPEFCRVAGYATPSSDSHIQFEVWVPYSTWNNKLEVVGGGGSIDDPAADYAILPTWVLARAAREAGLKVILSGEGGDELFGGYGRYRSVMRPWWAGGRRPRARGMLDDLGVLRGEIAGWRDGIAAAEVHSGGRGRTSLQAAQAVDCADWLPNDLLIKLDRCLMAHGAEGRTPFLDPEMAALAFRLPDELKIRRGLGKWILRRWLAGQLPQAQPLARKRGFTVPVGRLIADRAEVIGPLVARSPAVCEVCRPDAVESLFAAAGQRRAGRAAWNLVFYALWHRRHIERATLPPDTAAALAEPG